MMRKYLFSFGLVIFSMLTGLSAFANGYKTKIEELAKCPFISKDQTYPLSFYRTIEDLNNHQGKPTKITTVTDREISNPDDYWLDIEYKNKFFIYYYSTYKKQLIARLWQFSSNDWKYKYGITIGMEESQIIGLFGEPNRRDSYEKNYVFSYYSEEN